MRGENAGRQVSADIALDGCEVPKFAECQFRGN
jgi:hypothetical protein